MKGSVGSDIMICASQLYLVSLKILLSRLVTVNPIPFFSSNCFTVLPFNISKHIREIISFSTCLTKLDLQFHSHHVHFLACHIQFETVYTWWLFSIFSNEVPCNIFSKFFAIVFLSSKLVWRFHLICRPLLFFPRTLTVLSFLFIFALV